MLRMHALPALSAAKGAAAIAAVCSALGAILTPAAAQQEHHGVPVSSAQVVVMGTASCAEGTPLSGAIVLLFHGRHLMASSVADSTGRFVVRTGAGTYTLEISDPRHAPHRQQVTLGNAPVSLGDVRVQCNAVGLETVTVRAERDAVQSKSGATVVETRAS